MPSDEIPDRLDLEGIEIEITIRDTLATDDEYEHSSLLTETELEEANRLDLVKTQTELALDAALRQYLSGVRRGKDGDRDGPR